MRRPASAVTSGRAAARVGGSSSSAPTAELARPGTTTRTVPSATSTLSAAAPCTVAAVSPDRNRRMWRLTCEPASAMPTTNGPISALLSVPDGQGPWPGVVVVHDAFGYGPDNEATSARIAAAGFVAITPNMYSRGGRARCVTRVFRELLSQRGRALDDILAARDHVQSMPECTGSVGVVGFCMGGQFALVMAPKGFGASAPFYGTPLPRHLSETLDGACPIVASLGRRDPLGIGAPARLRRVVEAKGIA